MSYSNGILGWSGEVASSETVIVKGEKGDPGMGYKLTSDGNYHLQNKKIFNLDNPDDHKVDDDYNTRVKDLKSAVNKEYLNDKFLKKDKDGNDFDLKGAVIKNSEPYYDGLHDDNDLVPKKYVDIKNSKLDIAIADKTSKAYVNNADTALLNNINGTKQALSELSDKVEQVDNKKLNINGGTFMNVDLDMSNNKIINISPGSNNNDAINYQQLTTKANENETLLLDGSNKMAADLDMGNNKIINLSTDSHNMLSATNIRYINQVNGAMIRTLTDSFTKKYK